MLSTILNNTYGTSADLYVGGEVLLSREGTTQGDPLAMPMYAMATLPLIDRLQASHTDTKQIWFADDSSNGGKVHSLRNWWGTLNDIGPLYGYFPNAEKTWLLVKETHREEAERAFAGSGVTITTAGQRLLGAALGQNSFVGRFVEDKVNAFVREMEQLSRIALSQPQAAHAAFTHGLVGKWVFLCRTCQEISGQLQPLEDVICQRFIPALTGRECDSDVRSMLALPVRHGGLGLINPTKLAQVEYQNSRHTTSPLSGKIAQQAKAVPGVFAEVSKRRKSARSAKRQQIAAEAIALKSSAPPTLQRSIDLASERGASSWLTSLPLERHGFTLHKGAFRDAICLRYGWQPEHLPGVCVCGKDFTVAHAMSCPCGGYPTIRHNELRDVTAELLRNVCKDVTVEPLLQPLTTEVLHGRTCNRQDDARLDVSARGVWGDRFGRAFFDVRVFCPAAPTNQVSSLTATYKRHENEKRRAYGQRVENVEMGSFTPLIFSTTGGMGKSTTVFYKRLAGLIAEKNNLAYSATLAWVRTKISFALLRSAVLCLRGWRPRPRTLPASISQQAIEVAVSEAKMQY